MSLCRRFKALAPALLAGVLALAWMTPAMALQPYTATYELSRSNMVVGNGKYELSIDDDGLVTFHARAETAGLVSVFRNDTVSETSRLRLGEDGKLIAMSYEYKHRRGSSTEEEKRIDFDWENNIATAVIDGEQHRLEVSPGTVDRMALQLKVMQDMTADPEGTMRYETVNDDELREYEFIREGRYRIQTDAGEFSTIRLERKHDDRVTIFWSAPELGYLPVRVEQHRDGKLTMRMALTSVSGPLTEGP